MAHEIAKLILEKSETFLERSEAIKAAVKLGMPLAEVEAFLDWLDVMRKHAPPPSPPPPPKPPQP